MKYCTNCLAENKDEARFCKECGADLSIQSGVQSILKGKYLIGKAAEEAYEYTAYNGLNLADKSRVVICESTRRIRGDEEERTAAARFAKELENLKAGGKLKNLIQAEAFCEDGEAYVIMREVSDAEPAKIPAVESVETPVVEPAEIPGDQNSGQADETRPERQQPGKTAETAEAGLNGPVMAAAVTAFCAAMVVLTGFAGFVRTYDENYLGMGILVAAAAAVLFAVFFRKKLLQPAGMVILSANAFAFWWLFYSLINRISALVIILFVAFAAAMVIVPGVMVAYDCKKKGFSDLVTGNRDGMNHPVMAGALYFAPCVCLFYNLGSFVVGWMSDSAGRRTDAAEVLSIILGIGVPVVVFILNQILIKRGKFRISGIFLLMVYGANCFFFASQLSVLLFGKRSLIALLILAAAAAGIVFTAVKTGKEEKPAA
ncbi:MAG: zinc ribbon domain-containing protein [Eubacterium sp.]|nr:zinc ribbon domain-containing protein [Eubacterium sp.]